MKRSVIVLLTALALPAQLALAGMFDDKEARANIEKMRADVDSLSGRVELATKNQMDFANQSEAMKADLARLHGQLEVLLNDMEMTQKRQRDFYVDVDSRLRKLEAASTPEAKVAATTQKNDSAQETRDYEAALEAFKSNRYVEANTAMLAFIKSYPQSTLLPNAYYWAGSSHFQLHEFNKAIDLFAKVAATWPNDAKAPDALLAQSNALNEAGDGKEARKVVQKLIDQYPASNAAQTAKQRLGGKKK
jgi:tol-pal system protein YbgF